MNEIEVLRGEFGVLQALNNSALHQRDARIAQLESELRQQKDSADGRRDAEKFLQARGSSMMLSDARAAAKVAREGMIRAISTSYLGC